MTTTNTLPSNLPTLTALRGVAMNMVFIAHGMTFPLFLNQDINDAYVFLLEDMGASGLAIFFVLSGFVMTWSVKPGDTAGKFYRRRFFKIFPSHVVAWVAVLLLMLAAGHTILLSETLVSLPLLQGFFTDQSYHLFAVNGPTWSLSVELLFYAAFPLLLPLVNRIRGENLWFWLILMGILSLLMPAISRMFLPDTPPSFMSEGLSWPQQWFTYFFPPARIFEFLAGMIMAKLIMSGTWTGLRRGVPVVLMVVAYAGVLALNSGGIRLQDGFHGLLVIPIALLIGTAAASDIAGRSSLLTRPRMVWMGNVSYAFFLVHMHVYFLIHAAMGGQFGVRAMYDPKQFGVFGALGVLVATWLVSLLLAWALFSFVEDPMMRRFARTRQKVAV